MAANDPARRLLELAKTAAFTAHCEDSHSDSYDECSHADCMLTRSAAPPEGITALLERLGKLIADWRGTPRPTGENAALYEAFDMGQRRCADELAAALRPVGDPPK